MKFLSLLLIVMTCCTGNIDLVSKNKGLEQELIELVEKNDLNRIKELIKFEVNLDEKNENGWTSLMIAIKNKNLEIVKLLIENGANVNKEGIDGWTPLIVASQNGYKNIVELLLFIPGIDIDKKDENEWTALIYCVICNEIEITKLLLSKGASVNVINIYGESAVSFAAEAGNAEILKILLEEISNIDEENHPAICYIYECHTCRLKKALYASIAEYICKELGEYKKKNFSIEGKNIYECRLLVLINALRKGDEEIIKLLMEKGNYEIKDNEKYLEIIKLLMEKGVTLFDRDKNDITMIDIISKEFNFVNEIIEKKSKEKYYKEKRKECIKIARLLLKKMALDYLKLEKRLIEKEINVEEVAKTRKIIELLKFSLESPEHIFQMIVEFISINNL